MIKIVRFELPEWIEKLRQNGAKKPSGNFAEVARKAGLKAAQNRFKKD